MYQFQDLEQTNNFQPYIPSYAMLIDGTSIEERIPGFITTKVLGRELMNKEIVFHSKVNGKDGQLVHLSTYPARFITIEYILDAPTNYIFRHRFNQLNELFFNEFSQNKEFRFKDEEGFIYSGKFYGVSEVDTKSNSISGSFTLVCEDPYKYSEEIEQNGLEVINQKYVDYPIKIEEISVNVGAPTSVLKIQNQRTGMALNIVGTLSPGDIVKIKDNRVYVNGVSGQIFFDIKTSDFSKFEIYSGDQIIITPDSASTLKYKERAL